jgi:hypothetical protein
MKSIFAIIVLFCSLAFSACGTELVNLTNGVFYLDKSAECHLISQNGAMTTNQLSAGKTYMVGNVLSELEFSQRTTVFFSGGPFIQTSTNSSFTINLFDLEVNNLDATPRRAQFGTHNLSLGFNRGEFAVIYDKDTNSSFTVSTPYATYQLNNGKYFFRVTEKSVVVYVLDGMVEVHGDKRVDKTGKGKLAMAVPFVDPASGVEDKIITSIKTLKQDETGRFSGPIVEAEKENGSVQFFIIQGKVIGILDK